MIRLFVGMDDNQEAQNAIVEALGKIAPHKAIVLGEKKGTQSLYFSLLGIAKVEDIKTPTLVVTKGGVLEVSVQGDNQIIAYLKGDHTEIKSKEERRREYVKRWREKKALSKRDGGSPANEDGPAK
jgi:hypothetical protein